MDNNNLGSIIEEPSNNDDTSVAESWATSYALSIMGTRYTGNCPYGTGDGYGDGRAIVVVVFIDIVHVGFKIFRFRRSTHDTERNALV